jgi:hypothetical protein
MEKEFDVEVVMLCCGRLQLYNAYAKEQKNTHLNKKIEKLYKELGGTVLRENYLCLEVVAETIKDS